MAGTTIKAVVFDLGETLVDETRQWETVAQAAGIPFFTFAGLLGGIIERHLPHRAIFEELGIPPVKVAEHGYRLEARDFYPDAIPTLRAVQERGYLLGIAANQPDGVVERLAELDLPLDLNATSTSLGVAKPDPRFFEQIVARLDVRPDEIVYIGDRLDNDILPAHAYGMHAVFIKRGPWGHIHATWPQIGRVKHRISSLDEVFAVLDRIDGRD